MAFVVYNTSDSTGVFRCDGSATDTSDPWTTPGVEVVEVDQADDAEKEPEQEEGDSLYQGSPKPKWAPAVLHRERPRQVASGYG